MGQKYNDDYIRKKERKKERKKGKETSQQKERETKLRSDVINENNA